MTILGSIVNWYLHEKYTYIRGYQLTTLPHLFPRHVPNNLVLGEIM